MNNQQTKPSYRCFIEMEKHVYYPGDTVNCNAQLSFDRKFNCEEIVAIFTGEARVHWMEKKVTETSLCRHQTFYQRRCLFEHKSWIWRADLIEIDKRKESNLSDIVRFASPNTIRPGNLLSEEKKPEFRGFEAGKHILPVQFRIPEDVMYSSLEVDEELVSIRFKIEIHCIVDGRITKKFHQLINVVAPRDLTEETDMLGRSISSEKIHQSKKGKLFAVLTLPKTGYTPGEPLSAHVEVHNMSTHSVKFASVSIVKKITAIADNPCFELREREDDSAGSILPFAKIQGGERKQWVAQINVPVLTPNLSIEDFIYVNYEAKLSVGFERGKKNNTVLHISIPISIGTVAIDSSLAEVFHKKIALAEVSLMDGQSSSSESQTRSRLTLLNLPSAPPAYDDIVGVCPTYSSLNHDRKQFSMHQE